MESLGHLLPVEPTETGSGTHEGIAYVVPPTTPSPRDDPFVLIKSIRHHQASEAVLGAFIGPPQQEDPNQVWLQDPGLP